MKLIKKLLTIMCSKEVYLLIILPLFLSWLILPERTTKEINIDREDFPYSFYFNLREDINRYPFKYVATEILDTVLSLQFYNVCLENNSYIEKNNKPIPREDLVSPSGNLSVMVVPLSENIKLRTYFQLLKDKNENMTDYSNKDMEYSERLTVKPGETRCLKQLTSEDGFLFSHININTIGNSSVSIKDDSGDYSLQIGADTYKPFIGNSKMFITTSLSAFFAKWFIVFILIEGIILIPVEVFNRIKKIEKK